MPQALRAADTGLDPVCVSDQASLWLRVCTRVYMRACRVSACWSRPGPVGTLPLL